MNLKRSSISAVLAGILFIILMVARGGSGLPHKLHSSKMPRLLLSSCSMKYVDLSGDKPTAKGEPDTAEVELLFGFGDNLAKARLDLYIQSATTKRYLCFNSKGKQVLLKKFKKRQCEFNEAAVGGGHVSYVNVENPEWVLAYSHHGVDLAGDGAKSIKCKKFIKDVRTQNETKHEVQAAVDELAGSHTPKHLRKAKSAERQFSGSTFKSSVLKNVVTLGELSSIERFMNDELQKETVRLSAKKRGSRTNTSGKKERRKKDRVLSLLQR